MLRQGRIYLFSGDLHNSLQQAEKGLHEISSTHDDNGKGFLSVLLGRVLLAMGDAIGASARFLEASIKFRDNGILSNAYEATVYLYYSAVVQGQLERARDFILRSLARH